MRPALAATGLPWALKRWAGAATAGMTAFGDPPACAGRDPFSARPAAQRGTEPGTGSLLKTALYDYHVANGAEMAAAGGWAMPLRFGDSLAEAVVHCRSQASLFDASNLPIITLKGRDVVPFLERLVVADVAGLLPGTSTLTLFTSEHGGVIDDAVLTRMAHDELLLVANAGSRAKVLAHLGEHLEAFRAQGGLVELRVHDDRSLLALQGPQAASVLQSLVGEELGSFYFGQFRKLTVAGMPCWATRIGYTGEDGFELCMPTAQVQRVAEALHTDVRVRLAGIESKLSLRLEAGLCRYGSELSEEITPVEAGLAWTVGARRRKAFDFLGGQVIQRQLAEGTAIRRVGLTWGAGRPAEEHAEVLLPDGTAVGRVTSAGWSHCLNKFIAMGYVSTTAAKSGTALWVQLPGGAVLADARVTGMPFLPNRYHKPAASQSAAAGGI